MSQQLNEPTQGYKGLFKGMSENLNRPVGKSLPPMTLQMKAQQYSMGWEPWQQSYKSIYNLHHDGHQHQGGKIEIKKQQVSQVDIANKHYKIPAEEHFKSEASKQFQGHQNEKRVRPVKDRKNLLAAQIVLGNEQATYKTTTHLNHGDNLQLPQKEVLPQRQKPQRFDIISNKAIGNDRLQNTCPFDYWNENRDKKHISQNKAFLPAGKIIDPITNRVILR